uniref:Uncharacterized protein n=1 Tax=viral metagenome TaxID=1070528 RepID=A0A6C0IHE7_9ZZZZ
MASTKEYVINNLMAFAIVGIIIKLFFKSDITQDGTSGPANASIWGYGVVTLSVFSVMFLSFALASNMTNLNKDIFGFLKELLGDSLPSLLTLLILTWLITLNVTYFKRINQGKISNEYNQFAQMNTIFLVIQIIVLFMFLRDQTSSTANNKMSYIVYAMTFINVILISMMNIILRFFSTDG